MVSLRLEWLRDDDGTVIFEYPDTGRIETSTSAPDSDACAGCHNDPEAGGAGDFVANVFVLAQTLEEDGHEVVTAADGDAALAELSAGLIDVMLLDRAPAQVAVDEQGFPLVRICNFGLLRRQ